MEALGQLRPPMLEWLDFQDPTHQHPFLKTDRSEHDTCFHVLAQLHMAIPPV